MESKMESKIIKKTENLLVISWDKEDVGFGQLTMKWNDQLRSFELDSEFMGIDTVIEIFKACE